MDHGHRSYTGTAVFVYAGYGSGTLSGDAETVLLLAACDGAGALFRGIYAFL